MTNNVALFLSVWIKFSLLFTPFFGASGFVWGFFMRKACGAV